MMATIARLCLVVGLVSAACSPVLAKGAAGAGTYAADLPSAADAAWFWSCSRTMLPIRTALSVQTLVARANENRILENRG